MYHTNCFLQDIISIIVRHASQRVRAHGVLLDELRAVFLDCWIGAGGQYRIHDFSVAGALKPAAGGGELRPTMASGRMAVGGALRSGARVLHEAGLG